MRSDFNWVNETHFDELEGLLKNMTDHMANATEAFEGHELWQDPPIKFEETQEKFNKILKKIERISRIKKPKEKPPPKDVKIEDEDLDDMTIRTFDINPDMTIEEQLANMSPEDLENMNIP